MTRKHNKTKAKTSYNFLRELLQDQIEILVQQNQVALGIGIIDEEASSKSNSNNDLPMTPPMIPIETPIIDSGKNLLSDSMVSILPIDLDNPQASYTPPPTPFMGNSLQLILTPVMENGNNEGANGGIIIDDSQNVIQEPVIISDQNTDTIADNGNLDLSELILPPVSDGSEQDQNTSAGDNSGDMTTTLPVGDAIFANDDQEEGTEMQEIKQGDNLNLHEGDDVQDDSSKNSDDNIAPILPVDMGSPVDNGAANEVLQEEDKKEEVVVATHKPTFPNQLYLYSKGIANPETKGQELSEADLRSRESEDHTDLGLVKDRMAFMYSIFGGKVGDFVTDNSDLLGSDE